jgi:hypothetical protein
MEEAPENGKELSHSTHGNGMNDSIFKGQNTQEEFFLDILTLEDAITMLC